MGLNSDKTSKVFCINICGFSTRFYIFFTAMAQSSKFHENCGCFWSVHPIKPAVSSNDQIPRKLFCSRGVAWTRPPKSRPNRYHRKRSYTVSNIGNMMGCDHPSWVPVGPFAGELWHFEYISNMAAVRHFEFLKFLIFNHVTVFLVLTCCCIPNFIKIGSRVRPPDAHNCRMFNAPLLGNGRCHGNRIMADMSGT